MGWNRLSEKEQDIAIITWYEILLDAGVPFEHYGDCYRSAQQRKHETVAQGKDPSIVTPIDLCVEWRKIKDLHAELDNTRLLPGNAAASCLRCFGTGKEEMQDGTVRSGCQHLPISEEERRDRQAAAIQRGADLMKEALKSVGNPKPVERKPEDKGIVLHCTSCGRKQSSWLGWDAGDSCGLLLFGASLDGERVTCGGVMTQ